jgi:predicted amino acid racemase
MIQLETGDRREGVPAGALEPLARMIQEDPRLGLAGLSTNYACFLGDAGGVLRSVRAVAAAARRLRRRGMPVERVSGGNSSTLPLLLGGCSLPAELTELRCGEALLLGRDALYERPLPGCCQDAVSLRAEVLERYTKPRPAGAPVRVVLGGGWQDLGPGPFHFVQPGLREVGRSSDYLVAETTGDDAPRVGDRVVLVPSYPVMVAAWTSPFVQVRYAGEGTLP